MIHFPIIDSNLHLWDSKNIHYPRNSEFRNIEHLKAFK